MSPPSWTSAPPSHPIIPLQVVTEHRVEVPVSLSNFPLVIYFTYGNVNVSVLLSQLAPPSPSPAVSKSLLMSAYGFITTILIDSVCVCAAAAELLSCFSHVWLCATPWTAAHQAPPSLGFSRQEHWSRLPFPSPMHESEKWKGSHSVVSDSVQPHRRQPTRLLHPWDSPDKSTGVGCHFLLQCIKVKGEGEVAQSCPTVSDPMDCSPPGSSIHGIFQARVLEWGAIAFSKKHYNFTFLKRNRKPKIHQNFSTLDLSLRTSQGA